MSVGRGTSSTASIHERMGSCGRDEKCVLNYLGARLLEENLLVRTEAMLLVKSAKKDLSPCNTESSGIFHITTGYIRVSTGLWFVKSLIGKNAQNHHKSSSAFIIIGRSIVDVKYQAPPRSM